MTYQFSNRGSWDRFTGLFHRRFWNDIRILVGRLLRYFIHHLLTKIAYSVSSPPRLPHCCVPPDPTSVAVTSVIMKWLGFHIWIRSLSRHGPCSTKGTHENLLCGSSGLNLSIIYETANVFMDLIRFWFCSEFGVDLGEDLVKRMKWWWMELTWHEREFAHLVFWFLGFFFEYINWNKTTS